MTPFKFGKKNKAKDGDSPSSRKSNGSPQGGPPSTRSKDSFHSTPQGTPQGTGIQYDYNNNIMKSPQRPPPQQQQQQQQQQQLGGPRFAQMAPKTPWSRTKLLISPFPRYRHAASTLANEKGEVFVMGGLHNTSVFGDTWIIKPDGEGAFNTIQVDIYDNSPAPRVGHASVLCGNAFVVFGGDTVTNDDGEIDNDLYLFNMNSHTWTIPRPIGKKPPGRYGHSIGVVAITNFDSRLYLYGGQLDDTIYNDLAVFNLSSFRRPDVQWEWVTPADNVRPPPLTNHTMDVWDNKLWIFGGSNGKKLSNELWCFDPQTTKWDRIKTFGQFPQPVEEHASVVFRDCLIIHGGKNMQGDAVDDLFFLNMATKTWFRLNPNFALTPNGKYGHSLSILKDNKLLILGGHLPDYAQLGENLEPSAEDHGVGTLLHLLDLSNLNALVPGLYQYSTPNHHVNQEKFAGPQSIFTPPQGNNQSPMKQNNISPEKFNNQPYPQQQQQQHPTSSFPQQSFQSQQQQQQQQPHPSFPHQQQIGRGMSAEDVFQRDQNQRVQTPQKLPQRQQSLSSSHRTPSQSSRVNNDLLHPQSQSSSNQKNLYSSPEEELPLQIPSPIHSSSRDLPVPAPINKDDDRIQNVDQTTQKVPGAFPINQSLTGLDDFQTPSTSPSRSDVKLSSTRLPQETNHNFEDPQPYLNKDVRSSDILESYANGNSNVDLNENVRSENIDVKPKEAFKTGVSSMSSGATAIGAGAAAVGVAGVAGLAGASTAVKNALAGKDDSSPTSTPDREIPSAISSTVHVATPAIVRSGSTKRNLSNNESNNSNQEFRGVIDSLSKELESLKVSTASQIQAASEKVTQLENENANLSQRLKEFEESTPDDNEIKRKHIKLNTDFQLLNNEHQQLRSKFSEIEPIFSSNLLDLQRLNAIIKEQALKLEEQQRELQFSKSIQSQYDELKLKHDALLKENEDLQGVKSRSFMDSHQEVMKLNTGLDSFLSRYLAKDETTGEFTTRSLSNNDSSVADNEGLTSSLRAQIDELLQENEAAHSSNKELTTQLDSYKSTQSEIEQLRAKLADYTRIEENYKESLHSVKNANRALQISQSELNREKEISTKLQQELDELKLFRSKKSSRNATPVINQYEKSSNDEDEDDVANAHYNLKIRDLQAELFIIKKERDDLKDEALNLKKKLYNADNPSGSF